MEGFVINNGVLEKYVGTGGDVVIPDGVEEIGEEAFANCDSLKIVNYDGEEKEWRFVQKATNWVILLVIPAMIFAVGGDVLYIFGNGFGVGSFLSILGCLLSGICAFVGGFVGISVLRLLVNNTSIFQFSYYSFGLALLTFMLYLFT